MIVVNLFAGPGAGKSTTAAGLFFLMKNLGLKVELVTEYAKDKVYEGHLGCLEDQIYIFGKQQRRLKRLEGHVDIAITDSPLPLSILYNKDLDHTFNLLVMKTFKKYDNLNFFINRAKPYVNVGRHQTEREAVQLDQDLKDLLELYEIKYDFILGTKRAPDVIMAHITERIGHELLDAVSRLHSQEDLQA